MDYPKDFITAFNHAMLYEVGPWFDATDADTIAGNCSTPQQQRKVGYTNTPGDMGGLTKFGVAANEDAGIDVPNLTLDGAMQVFYNDYWVKCHCAAITIPGVPCWHFDASVNNGPGRAAKFLQQAVGATQDGLIGPATLALVNQQDPATLINALSAIRTQRYNTIVQNDPTQQKFLNGWLRRVSEVTQYALAQL